MSWVRDLADSDETCGNKARNLARLVAAGLPVPPGFVIDARAFITVAGDLAVDDPAAFGHVLGAAATRLETTVLDPDFVAEVERRARELGPLLVVRSSSSVEDAHTGAAPGLFASIVRVPARDVWTAIRAVWTSALTPIAATYTRDHGGRPDAPSIAVIVQPFVDGALATIYTRAPGAPAGSALWLQRAGQLERISRAPSSGTPTEDLVGLALAVERALGWTTGTDVELVVGERIWVVQARPVVHPPVVSRVAPPPPMLAALVASGRTWTLDVTHNPEPLSVAQADLVERVERAGFAPWSMRVCAGYLYTAARDDLLRIPVTIATVDELATRAAEIESRIERVLDGTHDLATALERYLTFYRIWALELVPLIAAARAQLDASQLRGARPSAIEVTLIAAARDELDLATVRARLAILSPAWDVAVPTFGESPGVVDEAVARMRVALSVLDAGRETDRGEQTIGRLGADLAERDDRLFAHAQWLVRRALLDRAAQLGWPTDDVCWIPIDDTLAGTLDVETVRRRAAAGRAAAERASRWAMPLRIGAAITLDGSSGVESLRGVGSGGTIEGRVVRVGSLLLTKLRVQRGDVVVVRAVTPALAVILAGASALVSETGGLLDHGAAMARELGIPCVVGCVDAWSILAEDQLVRVAGDAGIVTPLDT